MYPKNLIYTTNNEFSVEEVRARKYITKNTDIASQTNTTEEEKNNFSIFEDEPIQNSEKTNFTIFTDEESISKPLNNFSIYEDADNTPKLDNNFSIYEDNLPSCSKQIESKPFSIYSDEKTSEKLTPFPRILLGQAGSSSQRDEPNLLSLPKDGFVLGKNKSDNSEVIKDHIRSLISTKSTQDSSSQIIKLDKSSFNNS